MAVTKIFSAEEKKDIIKKFNDGVAKGLSQLKAAEGTGASLNSIKRWMADAPAPATNKPKTPAVKKAVPTKTPLVGKGKSSGTGGAGGSKVDDKADKIKRFLELTTGENKISKTAAAKEIGTPIATITRWVALASEKGELPTQALTNPVPTPTVAEPEPTAELDEGDTQDLVDGDSEVETVAQAPEAAVKMIPLRVIKLAASIVVALGTESNQINSTDPKYKTLEEALQKHEGKEKVTEEEAAEIRKILLGEEVVAVLNWSEGNLSVKNGVVTWKGKTLHGKLQPVLLKFAKRGDVLGLHRFSKFVEKVEQAVSWKVTNRLFDFVAVNNLEIDDDGDILAYKVVRSNYTDKHTGTFDNSIGAEIECNRNEVDDRDEVTCSNGFHVCSFDYIKSFSGNGDKLVIVKVNPADFVSIPVDYNSTKARVCHYKVVRDATAEFRSGKLQKFVGYNQ